VEVFGSALSYFTGKLESYLRYKEIPYTFRPLDLRHYSWVVPRALGAVQLPSVRLADGRWMSDTTPMIAWLETVHPEPAVIPREPVTRFLALLIEDYADEWLWRPAMHYRWSYAPDRRLAGTQLAQELIGLPAPLALRRSLVTRRQRRLFVSGDGIDRHTRAHAEATVAAALACMEEILHRRPFLLGDRPTIADFGLMGPVWRHFVHDPTPARLLQQTAPSVNEWAARMWNSRAGGRAVGEGTVTIEGLSPLLREIGATHLEALAANALAHRRCRGAHDLVVQGVTYRAVPTSAYRVWCLRRLRKTFSALGPDEAAQVEAILRSHGCWEPLWRVSPAASGHDPDASAPFCRATRMVRDGR